MHRTQILMIGLIALCLVGLGAQSAPAAPGSIPFHEIASGHLSGWLDSENLVITDPAQWQAVWDQAHSPFWPAPALPAVDFDAEQVVALFMGQQPTAGYSIEITRVVRSRGGLQVWAHWAEPEPGGPGLPGLTQPFTMAVIPKSSRPIQFVMLGNCANDWDCANAIRTLSGEEGGRVAVAISETGDYRWQFGVILPNGRFIPRRRIHKPAIDNGIYQLGFRRRGSDRTIIPLGDLAGRVRAEGSMARASDGAFRILTIAFYADGESDELLKLVTLSVRGMEDAFELIHLPESF